MNINAAGVIAEYNPFHNGHLWQIEHIRNTLGDLPVIVVMSGHFTQRGEYTILDKWQRAECAIYGGADIVFELPFTAACKSAEFFASGAVSILDSLNIVSHLCFGSECTNLSLLQKAAQLADDTSFIEKLKTHMDDGITYAAALEKARREFLPDANSSLFQPNSILAIEYIRALKKHSSNMIPFALPRKDAMHSDNTVNGPIASATAIRKSLTDKNVQDAAMAAMTPKSRQFVLEAMNKKLTFNNDLWEKLVLYRIRMMKSSEISDIADVSEGLENKIKKAAHQAASLQQLLETASGKRYPRTRIFRIIAQIMVLNCHTEFQPYARLLAFNNNGRRILKKLQQDAAAPIITNLPDFYNKCTDSKIIKSLDADINATDIFRLLQGIGDTGHDFRQKPVYIM